MSESGSGSSGHVSGGDSPSDHEDEDAARHDRLVRTLLGHTQPIWAVATDGTYIVSGSEDHTVKLWNLASGACLRTLVGHSDTVRSVAVTATGATIVSGSNDRTAKLWDLTTGGCVRTLEGHSHYVISVALSTCGKHIVSSSYDDTIKVWDARHYRRVPHVLIRSRARATLATPADGPLLERQLLHYVYCRNNPDLPSAEHWAVIPSGAFRLVIKFLVG